MDISKVKLKEMADASGVSPGMALDQIIASAWRRWKEDLAIEIKLQEETKKQWPT